MTKPTPCPRLSILQARRAGVAVIFRRGPSKWVEVIRWDTYSDRFERGAWLNGRIYERSSDLSPDGRLMLYYASRFKRKWQPHEGYTNVWTAISRPPWLTALALWPKNNTYNGGGLFLRKDRLWLNHTPEEAKPHPRHKPHGLRVEVETPGDEAVYERRLDRDGWVREQPLEITWLGIRDGWKTIRPQVRVRRRRDSEFAVVKQLNVAGLRVHESFKIEGPSGTVASPSGRVDWVDYDANGRLVVLADGTIRVARVAGCRIEPWTLLCDLRDDKPEVRRSPESARVW